MPLAQPLLTEPDDLPVKPAGAPDAKTRIAELELEVRQLRELLNMRSASHAERELRIAAAPVQTQTEMFSEV